MTNETCWQIIEFMMGIWVIAVCIMSIAVIVQKFISMFVYFWRKGF